MPVDHGRLFHENRFFFYLGSQSLGKRTGTMVFRIDDADQCFDAKINSCLLSFFCGFLRDSTPFVTFENSPGQFLLRMFDMFQKARVSAHDSCFSIFDMPKSVTSDLPVSCCSQQSPPNISAFDRTSQKFHTNWIRKKKLPSAQDLQTLEHGE